MGDYFRLARSQHSPNKNLNTNQFAYLSTNMENVPELLDDIPSVEMLRFAPRPSSPFHRSCAL